MIAYFRMSVNPNDEEAFKRIINYPARGIGQTTVGKILSVAMSSGVSLWTVICDPAAYALDVNSGTASKLAGFRSMMESFMADAATNDAQHLSERIAEETGIMRELRADTTVEGIGRRENVEELLANIAQFCQDRKEEGNEHLHMTDYLSEVSLMTDQDNETDEDLEKVTLMTVHAAKGLEFDAVFIVGLEENLFPSDMSGDDERQIEEERRLFYVAMTRARKYLTLLFATTRFKFGSVDFCTPSRFLKDIDSKYLNMPSEGIKSSWADNSGTVPFGSGGYSRISKPKLEPNGTVPGSLFEPKRRFESKGTVPGAQFRPKTEFEAMPQRKPWEQGKFQRVTENMLKDTAPALSSALKEGNIIEHERFGIGEVLTVEGAGDNAKARIRFVNVGEKTLLLKFARYKILK
jgi:DNA helicase-2/ATP-dependent DNA helicase PcrA